MLIQSHRGVGNLGPENTIESFELGWQMGFVPEADVRVTRDGIIVAFHDNDFTRLAPDAPEEIRHLSIGELTWDDIAGLDVGCYKGEQFRGQRIPVDLAQRFVHVDLGVAAFLQRLHVLGDLFVLGGHLGDRLLPLLGLLR